MKKLLFNILLLLFALQLQAQTAALARKYYQDGEFEKAAALYLQLHEKNRVNDYYFERYFITLLELEDYPVAEKMLKKAIKAAPEKIERYVSYGILFERQSKNDKAKEQYQKAIKLLPANQAKIIRLANSFTKNKNYGDAIATYEKGTKLMKIENMFAYEKGAVYKQKGDIPKMIENYLNSLEYLPNRMTNIQAFFQRELSKPDGFAELKKQLYQHIQKKPELTIYPEMMIWTQIHQGNFEGALRQAKALDKRLQENGTRIYRLARMAIREKDFEAGIAGFQYIIDTKGNECPYYIDAKQKLLAAKRTRLLDGYTYTTEELRALETEYNTFLDEFGRSHNTAIIMKELAELEAFYLQDIGKAIGILEEIIKMPRLQRITRNQIKIDLGDYYLIQGEIWESTLLYSQVDKEMKDAPLGEMARFKNAKLSYYKGDFEWAQDQLDVLKGSTSELISNDAIDLGVFIMDHYALDTTPRPMILFAKADLLLFQNKETEAIAAMDSINLLFKQNGLKDDILFAKAKIAVKKREYQKAISLLEEIPKVDKESILRDNAIFRLAEIYENYLNEPQKAMELYEQILFDHSGSLLTVEARKRFRKLRGDGA